VLTREVLSKTRSPCPLRVSNFALEEALKVDDGTWEDDQLPRWLHHGGPCRDSNKDRWRGVLWNEKINKHSVSPFLALLLNPQPPSNAVQEHKKIF